MYWAMRTSRNTLEHREFLRKELFEGRLRQGWGGYPEQDLRCIHEAWEEGNQLTGYQNDASRHWRMGNGPADTYMNVGDVVLVPNMPDDGLFTLVRIQGPYEFDINEEHGDFGHLRPVKVLTPTGVANEHQLVDARLRRSLRCRLRLWRISDYAECLERIIESDEDLTGGTTAVGRAESIVSDLVTGSIIEDMATRLSESLRAGLQGSEWETVVRDALEPLFPVTVLHTGGPQERGADLEIIISNPFSEALDWIVPVQIKDHEFLEGPKVVSKLEEAFISRLEKGHVVIAVVLLVTGAGPSPELEKEMSKLSGKYKVPFIFRGAKDFMEILARGFLKQF